jgi:L-alanine-DL-glutamate epimerase-like enolase superfamily enzyme
LKITNIQIDVVRRGLPDTGLDSDLGRFSGEVEQGVLRIFTDEGIEGNCFVGAFRGGGHGQFGPILNVLKPELLGRDPAEREWLWSRLPILSGRRGLSMNAWAPVDVALWDIAGKAAGVPVHKLLGTQRYETEVYGTYPPRHTTPEGYVTEAEKFRDAGFRAYKIHPGVMATPDVIDMVGRVRATVGDSMELMLDPNSGYDFRKAYDIGRALDDQGFYWFEDPVPYQDVDAISQLTQRLATPLCMSDKPEFQFYEASRVVRLQSSRLVRGTAAKLGITGLKKLCSMVEGFGMNCEIGTAGNSLLNAANLHVIFSVSNCAYFEYWMPVEAHRFGLVEDIQLNERHVIEAPTAPGIGYELDWDWINSHKVATLD